MKISQAIEKYPEVSARLSVQIRDIVAESEGNPEAAKTGHEKVSILSAQIFALNIGIELASVFIEIFGDLDPFDIPAETLKRIHEFGEAESITRVQHFCLTINAHSSIDDLKGKLQ